MQQLEIFDSAHKTAPAEQAKLLADALLEHELSLWRSGFKAIAGVDEAGRGPLAGPVVACACILPKGKVFHGVKDSKALKPSERKVLADHLTNQPDIFWALGIVSAQVIDEINILRATFQAMCEAVSALKQRPDFVLVDGRDFPLREQAGQAIVRGDATSQSIAAASIIAKVHRDEIMDRYHDEYPEYGFKKHKGYGTAFHLKAIEKHGACPIHRKSFAPLKVEVSLRAPPQLQLF